VPTLRLGNRSFRASPLLQLGIRGRWLAAFVCKKELVGDRGTGAGARPPGGVHLVVACGLYGSGVVE
jgi:hypothetical protein